MLFTLMKSTEPFLDEYYMLDLEEALSQAGFVNVHSIFTDPRHRTVTATSHVRQLLLALPFLKLSSKLRALPFCFL